MIRCHVNARPGTFIDDDMTASSSGHIAPVHVAILQLFFPGGLDHTYSMMTNQVLANLSRKGMYPNPIQIFESSGSPVVWLVMTTAQRSNIPNISDPRLNLNMPQCSSASNSYQQGCIHMNLEDSELWKSFHTIGTEMIITKHGRRMFPHCSISVSGLQPFANYVIMVDIVPADNFKYKWKKDQWEVAGKSEPQPPCRTYIHPDSPAVGSHWMKQSLSFFKMKLTNNTLDQHGHIILHSMHRYFPRFHVIQADSPHTVCWGSFQTFTFPETTFTAVTAYQNAKIIRLKIDHNPFAKGFREGGTHSHSKRCRSDKDSPAKKITEERKILSNKPAGLQRMPSASQSAQAVKRKASTQQSLKVGNLSQWAQEQDLSESIHLEPLELQEYDHSCEEQMVPASTTYQHYRSMEYPSFPLPPRNRDPTMTLLHAPPHSLSTADHGTQQQEYRYSDQENWSQYPLFSYSCW